VKARLKPISGILSGLQSTHHHIGHSTVFRDTIFGSVGDVSLRSQSASQYTLFHMPSGRVPEMKHSQAISKNDTGTQANTHLLQPDRHMLVPYIMMGDPSISRATV